MTLSELAVEVAKKKPAAASPTGGGLRINVHTKEEPKAPRAFKPVDRRSDPRCLGAECCGECLPMDWPERDPAATWEEARHGYPSEMAVVLSTCGKWAWLCLMPSEGTKPILLHRWPVAGRLSREAGGLAEVQSSEVQSSEGREQDEPFPKSTGSGSGVASWLSSLLGVAPNAGSDGGGR
jgi:hypothetical protein